MTVCKTLEDALQLNPDFWDICVSTHQHLIVLENIIQLDPFARIIIEKPICQVDQIPKLKMLLKNFRGKIVVNENYRTSSVTKRVKEIIEERNITIREVSIEMSKNRTQDIKKGGYIDSNVFFYEGPHMLTILENLIGECKNFEDVVTYYSDFEKLPNQGTAEISFIVNATKVNFFTSMIGDVKYTYCPNLVNNIEVSDTLTRNRVLVVHGSEETIVGFYEPITGMKRSQGAVGTYKDGMLKSYEAPICDDTMGLSLKNYIEYLMKNKSNPSPIYEAIKIVKSMDMLGPLSEG